MLPEVKLINSVFSTIPKKPEERLVLARGDHPVALIHVFFLCLTLGDAFYSQLLSFVRDVRIEEISDNGQTYGFLVKLPSPIED